jgi:hypothetical protein
MNKIEKYKMKNTKFNLLPLPRKMQYGHKANIKSYDFEHVEATINSDIIPHSEGYILEVKVSGIKISAHDTAGLFYARQTLQQLRQQSEGCLTDEIYIEDWPDYRHRGVMLDISRDKVPSMETLFHLVDLFASWKLNQLQLYMEHTFAYKNHRDVWQDASPLTAQEIQVLDKYCKERFIDLVPFQNSFGHMHRWLKHDRYRDLAECPEGWPMFWSMSQDEPFSICPTDERSFELLSELYDEFLPNFSSKYFMVGCDETFDVGEGRSKEYCEQIGGKGQLYIEFLNKIHGLVKQHGKTMMYNGDIIINYPELLDSLPKDAVVLHWGYGIEFPFDTHCGMFAKAGIPFFVLPSNSAYSSVAGRTQRAMGNIRNAAFNGLKHGALGLLNTEWGDCGHWHPLSVSYLGYAYGAAMSWYPEGNENIDIVEALDSFAFKDTEQSFGKAAYDLGRSYLKTMGKDHSSNLYMIIRWAMRSREEPPFNELSVKPLEETIEYIDNAIAAIKNSKDNLFASELLYAANTIRFASKTAIAFLKSDAEYISDIDCATKAELSGELKAIMEEHKRIWRLRNREGGLKDSLWWYSPMEKQLNNNSKANKSTRLEWA